jgi:hypothetical protein
VYSGYNHYNRQTNRQGNDIDDPNNTWFAQEPHWTLIEDLLGGTYQMRSKHRKYLMQEPRELDESYDNRLARSVCPPYYIRLERMLAGMLTRKPVRLNDTADNIREQLFDIDLQGNDLNVWTYETTRKMIRYGHIGVLVDAPASGAGGRPYWVTYTPRDILGYRTDMVDGQVQLTQLRLKEKVAEPEGLYGEKIVEQVRLLTPDSFEIHRKNSKGVYIKHVEGRMSLGRIPFSVAYSNRLNLLESRPPMSDIAELNLKAYQIQSDLDNQLHISAVPMLAFYGFPQNAEEVSAGVGEAIAFPPEGRAEYIEPDGKSYEAQFKRLEKLEGQINELGLAAVLGQKLSAETAEAKRIDRSQGDSTMMVVAQQVQDMIDNCLKFHGQYLNSEAGTCFVNRDFLSQRLEPQEILAYLQLYTSGSITQKTLLDQLTEGEVLGDEFDVEEEVEATQSGGLVEMARPTPQAEPDEPTEEDDAA